MIGVGGDSSLIYTDGSQFGIVGKFTETDKQTATSNINYTEIQGKFYICEWFKTKQKSPHIIKYVGFFLLYMFHVHV